MSHWPNLCVSDFNLYVSNHKRLLRVQISDFQGVLFDEFAAGFDFVAHEDAKTATPKEALFGLLNIFRLLPSALELLKSQSSIEDNFGLKGPAVSNLGRYGAPADRPLLLLLRLLESRLDYSVLGHVGRGQSP